MVSPPNRLFVFVTSKYYLITDNDTIAFYIFIIVSICESEFCKIMSAIKSLSSNFK